MFAKFICIFFLFHYTKCALLDLSCQDIRLFVNVQNAARLLIAEGKVENQPAASKMNMIVWDEELAAKAAKWASTYPKSIDSDQTIPSRRFLTSQSISVIISDEPNFKINPKLQQIMWFNENWNYTYGPFSMDIIDPLHAPVGHYTQMIWSNSIYLGCAISENNEDKFKKVYVVCEYGPRANILGQKPYTTGTPSKSLTCVADEVHCKYPYGEKCSDKDEKVISKIYV